MSMCVVPRAGNGVPPPSYGINGAALLDHLRDPCNVVAYCGRGFRGPACIRRGVSILSALRTFFPIEGSGR